MLCRGSTAQLQKIEFPWPQLTVIPETSRKQDEVRFVDNCLEMIVMLASWKGWIGEIEFCTYYITTSTISGRCQDTVIQVSYEGDFFILGTDESQYAIRQLLVLPYWCLLVCTPDLANTFSSPALDHTWQVEFQLPSILYFSWHVFLLRPSDVVVYEYQG